MNKQQRKFLGFWVVAFALYVVLAMAIGGRWLDLFASRERAIMFAFGATALVALLVCDMLALSRTGERGLFLGMPLILLSYSFTTLVVIIALRFISLPTFPLWVGVSWCCIALAGGITAAIGARGAAGYIEETDTQTARQTQTMRGLAAQARLLEEQVGSGPTKDSVHAVTEAIRFSDPVSSAATALVEASIQESFGRFRHAVLDGTDPQEIDATKVEVLSLVVERNELCKLGK